MVYTKSVPMGITGLWNVTAEEYHADSEYVSHSALEEFRDSIPRYAGIHIHRTIPRAAATPAMVQGTVTHAFILEPDTIHDRFLVKPEGDGRKAEVKEARQVVEDTARKTGKTIITLEQWQTAKRMAESVRDKRRHPEICEVLETDGLCEQSIRAESEYGGIKSRFDKLFPAGHALDIKTSSVLPPPAFARQAFNLGYHRQAAFYEDVLDLAFGVGQGTFLFLMIWTEEPYDAILYEMEVAARSLGRAENHALLAELAERRAANNWTSRWGGLQTLELPSYAYK